LETTANIEIVETQEESEKDDEIIFKLLVNGKTVSWAKSTLYSSLDDIHTVCREKCKGYGRELLSFMEKNAKKHGATSMTTCDFDSCNDEAASFFKNMCYDINPSLIGLNGYLKGRKLFK